MKWEEDYGHKEKIMKNMCEYPFILDGDPNKARLQTADVMDNGENMGLGGISNQFLPRLGSAVSANKATNKSFTTGGGVNESMLGGKGGKPLIR